MSIFVAVTRVALVLIFLIAGVTKLPDLPALRQTLASLGLPPLARRPAALGLPIAEVTAAAMLSWRASAVPGAILATALALLFVSAVVFALATRRAVPCRCFGNLGRGALDRAALGRDLGLLALCGVTLAAFLTRPGLRVWLSPQIRWPQLSISAALAISFTGLILAVVSFCAWLITALVRQNARLLRELAAIGGELDAQDPTPFGSVAPSLAPSKNGQQSTRPVLAGFRTLLIFSDVTCGACAELLPEVAAWQKAFELAGRRETAGAQIVVIAPTAAVAREPQTVWPTVAVNDPDNQVARRYGVTAIPVALVVDENERIASRKAHGPEEIRHLYRHFRDSVMPGTPADLELADAKQPPR